MHQLQKDFYFLKKFKNYYKYIKINYNNMHDIIADYIIAFKIKAKSAF